MKITSHMSSGALLKPHSKHCASLRQTASYAALGPGVPPATLAQGGGASCRRARSDKRVAGPAARPPGRLPACMA